MSDWRQQVEDLLYDGESVHETVDFAEASVVVTSHRVLAFTPELAGANFQQVERPNVDGVSTGAETDANLLERGLRFGLTGALLVLAGHFIDFGGIIGSANLNSQSTSELGLGGVMGTLQSMLNLLSQLDDLMQTFGALALLLAVVLLGVYWYTREETLVIEVAGGENIRLPRPADATAARERLEHALTPERRENAPAQPQDPLQS